MCWAHLDSRAPYSVQTGHQGHLQTHLRGCAGVRGCEGLSGGVAGVTAECTGPHHVGGGWVWELLHATSGGLLCGWGRDRDRGRTGVPSSSPGCEACAACPVVAGALSGYFSLDVASGLGAQDHRVVLFQVVVAGRRQARSGRRRRTLASSRWCMLKMLTTTWRRPRRRRRGELEGEVAEVCDMMWRM